MALVVAPMVTRWVGAIAVAVLLAGCGGNRYVPPPPAEVTVAHPVERDVTTYEEFSGHTVSVAAVEIRARVQGTLQSFHFQPGSEVREGDLLFVIEPDLYEARVAQFAADLARTEAQEQAAEEQLTIAQTIFQRNAGSKTDLVQKTQARDEAKAAVAQAQANLAAAKLDLSYTHIYAPISGRIDRNYVDVGNLVGAGQPTLLASIVRDEPIYAYFDVSERDLLTYPDLLGRAGARPLAYLGLVTEHGFPHEGTIDYTSNRIDPSTGTIEVRAIFANPDSTLLPGMFVRVRVPAVEGRRLLVPDDALGADQTGPFVLVVDEQNTVQHRRVHAGPLVDGLRIIESGLQLSDWVIVNGLQRARPGTMVKPIQTTIGAGPTPAVDGAR
jgi:RND family efflux transporter MFP subunit